MRSKRRVGLVGVLVLIAALALAGCGSHTSGGHPFHAKATDAPDANVPIHGTDNGKIDKIAGNAITDIQGFWTKEMPKVFKKQYEPVKGGFFSVDPSTDKTLPPCAQSMDDIKGNAFYCPSKDVVVWDRTGLLQQMTQNFGKYSAAMILAHEWGHAIQARSQMPSQTKTIVVETQADCYSGAFTAYAKAGNAPHFHIDGNDLDKALAGYLNFADAKGSSQDETGAHGNAFDRISAFQAGFTNGPSYCASPDHFSDNRKFTELPYSQTSNNPNQDQSDNGNAPYAQAVQLGVADLNQSYAQLPGWKPLAAVKPFDPTSAPSCGSNKVSQNIFYCPDDNTVYFDNSQHFPQIYQNFGDFSVQALIATAYGFAYLHDQGKDLNGSNALLGAACYTGAYTYQVFAHGDQHKYFLSPGDLDEGVQALLLGVDGSSYYGLQGTTGFDRVSAFQQGFQDALQVGFQGGAAQGASVCSNM